MGEQNYIFNTELHFYTQQFIVTIYLVVYRYNATWLKKMRSFYCSAYIYLATYWWCISHKWKKYNRVDNEMQINNLKIIKKIKWRRCFQLKTIVINILRKCVYFVWLEYASSPFFMAYGKQKHSPTKMNEALEWILCVSAKTTTTLEYKRKPSRNKHSRGTLLL